MITILTNMLPILTGFIAKMMAENMKQKAEQQKLMLQAMGAREESLDKAREFAKTESPMAALTRRVIFFTILALIVVYVLAPVIFDVQTVIPVVEKGVSILGFEITGDKTTFVPVDGMVKYEEVFGWASMIIEFYVGSQVGKTR